tara:strand:- start:240 stop:806 length:567 start_codon:yes stop_codon:yes gene_type:complete
MDDLEKLMKKPKKTMKKEKNFPRPFPIISRNYALYDHNYDKRYVHTIPKDYHEIPIVPPPYSKESKTYRDALRIQKFDKKYKRKHTLKNTMDRLSENKDFSNDRDSKYYLPPGWDQDKDYSGGFRKKSKHSIKMLKKNISMCKGKSVKKPNSCKKVKGCKVAKGTKKSFCRKKHNKSKKNKITKKKKH